MKRPLLAVPLVLSAIALGTAGTALADNTATGPLGAVQVAGVSGNDASSDTGAVQVGGGNAARGSTGTLQFGTRMASATTAAGALASTATPAVNPTPRTPTGAHVPTVTAENGHRRGSYAPRPRPGCLGGQRSCPGDLEPDRLAPFTGLALVWWLLAGLLLVGIGAAVRRPTHALHDRNDRLTCQQAGARRPAGGRNGAGRLPPTSDSTRTEGDR